MTMTTEDLREIEESAVHYPLVSGAIYSFTNLVGQRYSILVEDVTETEVTLRNAIPGCMEITISHKAAYDILQDCSKVQPLDGYSNGTIPT